MIAGLLSKLAQLHPDAPGLALAWEALQIARRALDSADEIKAAYREAERRGALEVARAVKAERALAELQEQLTAMTAERDALLPGKPGPGADLLPTEDDAVRLSRAVLSYFTALPGGKCAACESATCALDCPVPLAREIAERLGAWPIRPRAAVPPPPPAAPPAEDPAVCTVGDLRRADGPGPVDVAEALDDLRDDIGQLIVERGTRFIVERAAARGNYKVSKPDGATIGYVVPTGKVRRTGEPWPTDDEAAAPAVEVQGSKLTVDGKEHPKAAPAPAVNAYDALRPDPSRCPDVRTTLELLDAAVNVLPEGPAREAVSLARIQWRDGDRASALALMKAMPRPEGPLPKEVLYAVGRMAADIERDCAAAQGGA